jgi:hypothetical protein
VSTEDTAIWSIREGLDQHADTCPLPAEAILIHPVTQAHLGWDEICGLPVLGDEAVPEGRFRVRCEGSSHGVEEQATLWLLESLDPELQPADATAPTGHRAS